MEIVVFCVPATAGWRGPNVIAAATATASQLSQQQSQPQKIMCKSTHDNWDRSVIHIKTLYLSLHTLPLPHTIKLIHVYLAQIQPATATRFSQK